MSTGNCQLHFEICMVHRYTYVFSKDDVEELVAAVDKIKASGVSTEDDVLQVCFDH